MVEVFFRGGGAGLEFEFDEFELDEFGADSEEDNGLEVEGGDVDIEAISSAVGCGCG